MLSSLLRSRNRILCQLPMTIDNLTVISWPNTVFARALANAIQRYFYSVLNARTTCYIFLHNWTQWIYGRGLILQRYVRKGYVAKLSNSQLFRCYQENPVKCSACVVSQNIAIKCGIAFSEIRLFLKNQSLEFQENWQKKNSSETTWNCLNDLSQRIWIWTKEFFTIQSLYWKPVSSKLY